MSNIQIDIEEIKLDAFSDRYIQEFLESMNLGEVDYFFAMKGPSFLRRVLLGMLTLMEQTAYIVAFNQDYIHMFELSKLSSKKIIHCHTIPWAMVKEVRLKSTTFNMEYRMDLFLSDKKIRLMANKKIKNLANQKENIEKFMSIK